MIRLLDHGYVTLRNLSGPTRRLDQEFDASDVDPSNVARMSFGNSDSGRSVEADLKLAGYLMKNWHTGPFEQLVAWFEMKLPIMTARQLVRHRTARLNEISGRYVQLPQEWYIPAIRDIVLQHSDKKQGGRPVNMEDEREVAIAMQYCASLHADCKSSYMRYENSIASGIAMEQARLHLHLNHYTVWIYQIDLHNGMNLLARRDHGGAQGEAVKYARAMDVLLRKHLPHTMSLYDDYRRFP